MELAAFQGLIAMPIGSSRALVTEGNRVETFTGGHEMSESFFAAIAGARHHIHIAFYITHSTEITPERYVARSARVKVKESVSRLFSPILLSRLAETADAHTGLLGAESVAEEVGGGWRRKGSPVDHRQTGQVDRRLRSLDEGDRALSALSTDDKPGGGKFRGSGIPNI